MPRRTVLGAAFGGLLIAAPAGCTTWPAPTVPMAVRRIPAPCAASAPTSRCVLLPGVYSRGDDFVTEGFVADLQQAAPGCEALLADAHLGYFVEGEMLRRLREDVVPGPAVLAVPAVPASGASLSTAAVGARHAAATRPWLVGISLGGFAALAYAMRHGAEIAGVLAIAPYLGRRELLRDISAAGGPLPWSREPAQPREAYEAIEEEVWRWLAQPGLGAAAPGPPIYLGFGRNDRFADAQRLLAAMLPAGHTVVVEGGHDWPPWRAVWRQWLGRGLLGERAAIAGCAGKP